MTRHLYLKYNAALTIQNWIRLPSLMKSTLRIATRKSPLALWQAEHVKSRLMQAHEGLEVELVTFTTQGDKILDTPLAKIGGKGLFVKELEMAILEGKADIAAHSIKDVPMEFPEGLFLSTILEREEPAMHSSPINMIQCKACRKVLLLAPVAYVENASY